MPDKPHYTAEQMIAALQETKGMVYLAAKRLGCAPQTVFNYIERHPSVQAAKQAERGEMIDTAELKLWQSIQNGEAWGIGYCLSRLGKDRGYVERTEQHVSADKDMLATLTQMLAALPTHDRQILYARLAPNGTVPHALLPHEEA